MASKAEDEGIRQALTELRQDWGIQHRRLVPVLCALAGERPVTVEDAVVTSGLSHRSVTGVVRRLEPWLMTTGAGLRLEPAAAHVVSTHLGCDAATHELQGSAGDEQLLATMENLVGAAPARRRELDHVAATPITCLARARRMASAYSLEGAHVVCLGDHDLTSLALALVAPATRISVVDVDDRLLEYVEQTARRLDRQVSCYFADLRLEVPRALRQTADLVFTDPPYTPEGVGLFAVRACELASPTDRFRLLLCHGYGDRQPALGLRVQSALHALRLVFEAIEPGFNRYRGAHALGSVSALYTLRPTPATWRAIERQSAAAARIYTHGRMALESPTRPVPAALERAALDRLAREDGRPLVAGDGWTASDVPDRVSIAQVWERFERHALATPARRPELPAALAIDSRESPALGLRLLLANRTARLLLVLPAPIASTLMDPTGWQGRLLSAGYRLEEAARSDGTSLLDAIAVDEDGDAAALVARYLLRHPAASLRNLLREAVIAAATARGRTITKNEARHLIEGNPVIQAHGGSRTVDLPLHALREAAALATDLVEVGTG